MRSRDDVSFAVIGLNVFGSEKFETFKRPPRTPGSHEATRGGSGSGAFFSASENDPPPFRPQLEQITQTETASSVMRISLLEIQLVRVPRYSHVGDQRWPNICQARTY